MNKKRSLLLLLGLIIMVNAVSHHQSTSDSWALSQSQTNFQNLTNLNAANWIFGNQTIEDYNKELYNFLINNNVTKCPMEKPFLRGQDSACFDCKGETPLFDLKSKDCTNCPSETQFNPKTHTCDKGSENKCSSNYVWSDTQNKCICPDSFPIDLGCECIKCLDPFEWNQAQKTCKFKCKDTYTWNGASQKCECPSDSPYEINDECIACSAPFNWQQSNKTCALTVNTCATPSNTTVTPTQTNTTETPTQSNATQTPAQSNATETPTQSNVTQTPAQSNATETPTKSNVTQTPAQSNATETPTQSNATKPSNQCQSNFLWDDNVKICICPSSLPFNDGSKCVQCLLPQYWDHSLRQCLFCPNYQYFNINTQDCESCPDAKPLWRNYQCEACPDGISYDVSSKSCKSISNANYDSSINPESTPKVPVYSNVS